jgi:hypothetical protein
MNLARILILKWLMSLDVSLRLQTLQLCAMRTSSMTMRLISAGHTVRNGTSSLVSVRH